MANCYCKLSGVSFSIEGFGKTEIITTHPIFDLPLDRLVQRAGYWASGRMGDNEERLFFLALLANTELVHFRVTATPPPSIVKQNTQALLSFINWYRASGTATIPLPEFVIDNSNRHLGHIATWLRVWNDAKQEWLTGYTHKKLKMKLSLQEAALDKLIHSNLKTTEDYAGRLATWAMEAANVPVPLKEFWTKIFRLKGYEIYGADWFSSADIDECLEHMEANLDAYNSSLHTNTVLSHLRKIKELNNAGFAHWLGMSHDNSMETVDQIAAVPSAYAVAGTYKIIGANSPEDDSNLIQDNTKAAMVATYAPKDSNGEFIAPNKKDYATVVAYMRAKAAYNLSVKSSQ